MPKQRTKRRGPGGRKGKKSTRGRGGGKWAPSTSNSSTLSGPRINPDELDVRLLFRTTAYVNNAGTGLVTKEFTPNSAYDVDPALGSTETYGFDEYAALYSYYRVISYSYDVTFVNQGDDPIMCYVLNTNTSPSASGTRYDLYSTNPYCKSRLVSAWSPTKTVIRGSIQISRLLGSRAVETSDSFRSLTTGSPADLIYCSIAAETISPSAGVYFCYDVKITMKVRFFGRELDLSLAGLASRVNEHLANRAKYELQKKLRAAGAAEPKKSLNN